MAKQKLTPTARRMKAIRDKKAAMTASRRKKRAEIKEKEELLKKQVKIFVVKIMTTKRKSSFL